MKSIFIRLPFCLIIIFFLLSSGRTNAQFPAIQWEKNQCGPDGSCQKIIQTPDGGYIFTGNTQDGSMPNFHGGPSGDALVVKLDSNGQLIWSKCYGGSDNDMGYDILLTADGNYLFIGETKSADGDVSFNNGLDDVWLMKLNDTGGIIWQKTYGGPSNDEAYGGGVETSDSGFVIAARTSHTGGDVTYMHPGGDDYWILKINASGTLLWQKAYGGSSDDEPGAIHKAIDGGFIISGSSASNDGDVTGNHGSWDIWMLKINDTGMIEWQKSLGGSQADICYHSCQMTSDSGCIVIGTTYSNDGDVTGFHGMPDTTTDIWVVKLSNTGTLQWQKTYGGTGVDLGYGISELPGNNYIISGYTYSADGDIAGQHGGADAWVATINSAGTLMSSKCAGGTNFDAFYTLFPTSDGGYVAGGVTQSNNGDVTDTFSNYAVAHSWVVKFGADSSTIGTLGNNQLMQNDRARVYPSPTNGLVNITVPAGSEDARIIVTNLLGQQIPFEQHSSTGLVSLNFQDIADGMYVVQIIGKEKSQIAKIIFKK